MKTAYFAGGCFWCITPVFAEIPGVAQVVSGYSGGREINPTYEDVKHQRTSHRETIAIHYDEAAVSFESLLDIFLDSVDPFDPGGQFIDRGRSYTLAVYYKTEAEAALTRQKIQALQTASNREVCISVEPFSAFYNAEEYHQDYYRKNPEAFREELVESGRIKL